MNMLLYINLDSGGDFDRSLEGIVEDYPELSIMEGRQHVQGRDSVCSDDSQSTPKAPSKTPVRLFNASNRSLTPVRHSRSLKSPPLHSFRQSKNISIRSRDVQYACDTPLSFSAIFTEDSIVFENSDNHYYNISTMAMLHESHEPLTELDILLDQCFQCHVTDDFILHIIFGRRKVDSCAKMFLQNQPPAIYKRLKTAVDDTEGCEIS